MGQFRSLRRVIMFLLVSCVTFVWVRPFVLTPFLWMLHCPGWYSYTMAEL